MNQAFPNVGTPLVDTKTGAVTIVWRSFFTALWINQGGGSGSISAPAAGNKNQTFNVAAAAQPSNAVPLAQAQASFAALAGSQTQAFAVGNAPAGSNCALRRSQAEGLFAGLFIPGGDIQPVTVTASPFAYTATQGGTLYSTGGTVTGVTLSRSGTTIAVPNGATPVRTGDVVTFTYSAAPTVNFSPT